MSIILPIVFALVGFLVGWAYFAVMRYSLTGFAEQKTGAMTFLGFIVVRFVLFFGGALAAIAVSGWSFLGYAVGFIVARTVVVGKARAEAPTAPDAPTVGERDAGQQ